MRHPRRARGPTAARHASEDAMQSRSEQTLIEVIEMGRRCFRSTRFVALRRVRRTAPPRHRCAYAPDRVAARATRLPSPAGRERASCRGSSLRGTPASRLHESALRKPRPASLVARSRRARGGRRARFDRRSRIHASLTTKRRALRRAARDHICSGSASGSRTQ